MPNPVPVSLEWSLVKFGLQEKSTYGSGLDFKLSFFEGQVSAVTLIQALGQVLFLAKLNSWVELGERLSLTYASSPGSSSS